MRVSTFLPVALAGAFLAACEANTPVTEPPSADAGISTSVTSGPGMPGHSHLIRIGIAEWVISTADPDAEMFTIYGNPTMIFDCGGPGGAEYSVQFNELELAMGRMRNILAQGSEVELYVYDFFTPDDLVDGPSASTSSKNGSTGARSITLRCSTGTWYRTTPRGIGTRTALSKTSRWEHISFHESQLFVRAANGNGSAWIKESIMVTPRGNR